MDTAFPQKIPFILDRNLAKANCTEDRVCTSCDKVVLDSYTSARTQPIGDYNIIAIKNRVQWTQRVRPIS